VYFIPLIGDVQGAIEAWASLAENVLANHTRASIVPTEKTLLRQASDIVLID
jgi:hypothetical protein